MVLGDVLPDVSNPKMILHNISTSHMNFIQNKYLNLKETCLCKQGHLKANHSKVMDDLGRPTSKIHET